MLRQKRKNDREAVSEDDCLRAISKLKVFPFRLQLLKIINIKKAFFIEKMVIQVCYL